MRVNVKDVYNQEVTKRLIRVEKKNSAFVYAILESLEGMASYSTVDLPGDPVRVGKSFRDIELCIPDAFVSDIEKVLQGLSKEFSILDLSHLLTTQSDPGGAS